MPETMERAHTVVDTEETIGSHFSGRPPWAVVWCVWLFVLASSTSNSGLYCLSKIICQVGEILKQAIERES